MVAPERPHVIIIGFLTEAAQYHSMRAWPLEQGDGRVSIASIQPSDRAFVSTVGMAPLSLRGASGVVVRHRGPFAVWHHRPPGDDAGAVRCATRGHGLSRRLPGDPGHNPSIRPTPVAWSCRAARDGASGARKPVGGQTRGPQRWPGGRRPEPSAGGPSLGSIGVVRQCPGGGPRWRHRDRDPRSQG